MFIKCLFQASHSVKEVVEQWHLSDHVTPTETAFHNSKWTEFPPGDLFRWTNCSHKVFNSKSYYPGRLGKPVMLEPHEKAIAKGSIFCVHPLNHDVQHHISEFYGCVKYRDQAIYCVKGCFRIFRYPAWLRQGIKTF